jgi:heat shock protein 1/8
MPGGGVKTLTRPLLEKVCADVLRELRLPVEVACDSAGINLEALQAASRKKGSKKSSGGGGARKGGRPFDHILLVGGATKTPAVRRFVENTFGRRPRPGLVNPDEVVAVGAAVHAGALEGLLAETETLGPMQASMIRAFARRMRKEQGAEDFDAAMDQRMDGDGGGGGGGGAGVEWDAAAMAAAAAAAGMDLQDDDAVYFDADNDEDEEEDDWGPEDLSELLSDGADGEAEEAGEGAVISKG